MDLTQHPCFNKEAHHRHGRVHLPVAPRCNMQCKFCNRKFDCVNESRPGVTSAILTPAQAMHYLDLVLREKPAITVVGIAGPGDPFANPDETLETLSRVRAAYPDMMLCVATNGLSLLPFLDDLQRLAVSHVTLTINAVDPDIGARIYSWMRVDGRIVRAAQGAGLLLERQLAAVAGLKARGMIVKINSIVLPGINDGHIEVVARRMARLGADIFNCMPYYPNPGSAFEHLAEPGPQAVADLRVRAAKHIRQMDHCTRCRADAAGLLGETPSKTLMTALGRCARLTAADPVRGPDPSRPYVAVASMEGALVNQHLGEARRMLIYGETPAGENQGRIGLVDVRPTPEPGGGDARWRDLAASLGDCRTLLVSGIGDKPAEALRAAGLEVILCEGLIEEAVRGVFCGEDLARMAVRKPRACGAACGGTGGGCG